ncbi:MAG: DctP family TRAP transporter solute-binding subunit [Kiritimatiellaeota bacterium]|nr:DctP family TRAP transporter solute-binding subunit [Kiritimatiellota bacterium]
MRMMEFAIPAALALAASLLLVSCGGKKGLKKEYRMQVNVGSSTYWGMGAAKFAELVRKRTNGRINVKPYYGSQLLKGAQLNSSQMVAAGAIDCALESTINTAPMINAMNIFTMPFFVNTYKRLDRLEKGGTGSAIFAKMRAKRLEPLAWGENGFRQLTNSKLPVKKPEDLRNLKIRVVGSPIFIDVFRALGADPVNMNWGDAVTALQQGTVDGQENPAGILLAVKIFQYNKRMTRWNYAIDPLILYWNKEQFDAFPPDIRKAIRKAAVEATRYQKALCRAGLDDGTALKTLKNEFGYDIKIPDPLGYLRSKGMEITEINDDARAEFKKNLKSVTDSWTKQLGAEFVKNAKKDMEE